MLEKLKGLKTYAIAALLAAVAALSGADLTGIEATVSQYAPEVGAVLAAGIVLGRAIVSLFGALRAKGVIASVALAPFLAVGLLAASTLPLTACATIEQTAPQTPRDAYAAAEITFNATVDAANAAYQAGYLSQKDAEDLLDRFRNAEAFMTGARDMIVQQRQGEARDYIATALQILTGISAILEQRAAQSGS